MKSTVSNSPCKATKPFPKLMQSTNSTAIVLFESPESGTVVAGISHAGRKIGQHHSNFKPESFVDFNGSVCLENN